MLAIHLHAQESLPPEEIPSAESTKPAESLEPASTERIVEGRPTLYTIKRVLHPLSWPDAALRPVFKSSESGFINRLLVNKPQPKYVRFGVTGVGTGSGFGPVVTPFHNNALGKGIQIEAPLLYTYRGYESYQFKASVPLATQSLVETLSFDLGTAYKSRTMDQFFGIGNDSLVGDETQFRTVTREASAGFTANVNEHWTTGVWGVFRSIGVTEPAKGLSLHDHFSSSAVPGFSGDSLGSVIFSVGRNTQVVEDNAFKGGIDQLDLSFNNSVRGGDSRYWRYRFTSQHFIPLTSDARKVIAVRALLEGNQGRVPFFDMPILGTASTLRGYENFRFRDKSALALTVEYRYRIWPRLDWGIFMDQGQVAPHLGDMGWNQFHSAYGMRLFVWAKPTTPISFDYGRSGETWRLYVNFSPRF